VTAVTNIDDAVFVFKTTGGAFDHVATPLDMETYPDTQVAAALASLTFYRQNAVTKTFTTVQTAQDFADTLRSRLTSLANEYTLVVTTFLGTTTETVPH
jgi:hypothetical protein